MHRTCTIFTLFFAVVFAFAPPSQAQKQTAAAVQTFESARAVYGLTDATLKPWHLKATYQIYDEKGAPSEEGTFEEFWASPTQYKLTFSRPSYHRTLWGTSDGKLLQSPGKDGASVFEDAVARQLTDPLPTRERTQNKGLSLETRTIRNAKWSCLEVKGRAGNMFAASFGLFPYYCFMPDKPILRISRPYLTEEVTFDGIGKFQNRYVSTSILIEEVSRGLLHPFVRIKVTELSLLPQVDPAIFTPPADAVPAAVRYNNIEPKHSQSSDENLNMKLVEKIAPYFPPATLHERATGAVKVNFVVGLDGRIHNLKLLEAPDSELAKVTIATISQWRYTPPQYKGQNIEVDALVSTIYKSSSF